MGKQRNFILSRCCCTDVLPVWTECFICGKLPVNYFGHVEIRKICSCILMLLILAETGIHGIVSITDNGTASRDIYVESEQEELSSEIIQESSRNNLTWVVVNEDNTKYLCWPENEDQLRSKLFFGYASDLDMDNGKGTILKQTDNCVVQQVYDRFVGMDYVECWGKFDNGNYFLIRSLWKVSRKAQIFPISFYFFVGIVIIVISGMCIMAVTRKLTRPISELTELSRKMTDLDLKPDIKARPAMKLMCWEIILTRCPVSWSILFPS